MIAEILTRLTNAAPALTSVEFAEDIDGLVNATQRDSGAAFVVPFRERARPSPVMTAGHRQMVSVQFLVAFVSRNYADDLGAHRVADFSLWKGQIEQALAGWTPASGVDPCELVGGESSPLGTGVSIYVQTWETSRLLTGA